MLFNFDYLSVGFAEEEWEKIPRTDKLIIRDFETNSRDVWQTALFGWYETDDQVRKAVKKYDLRERPRFHLSLV